MTTTQLIAELTQLGIRLEARGDRLGYCPRSAVTPAMAEQIKAHKTTLLATLRNDDEAGLVVHLVDSDELDPDGWPKDSFQWPAPGGPWLPGASANTEAESPPGACDKCGSTECLDVTIHDGQSTRRDCVRCGRTHGFPVWYGINRTNDDE